MRVIFIELQCYNTVKPNYHVAQYTAIAIQSKINESFSQQRNDYERLTVVAILWRQRIGSYEYGIELKRKDIA
ncbi:hypothetical protein MASR2M18_15820 [Ignavibacteria bacterium]|nr:hypothetical protein [Bacteroidota bacterium]MCZ2133182.1 hypothetical protein [Bacteroidota bacterium]